MRTISADEIGIADVEENGTDRGYSAAATLCNEVPLGQNLWIQARWMIGERSLSDAPKPESIVA